MAEERDRIQEWNYHPPCQGWGNVQCFWGAFFFFVPYQKTEEPKASWLGSLVASMLGMAHRTRLRSIWRNRRIRYFFVEMLFKHHKFYPSKCTANGFSIFLGTWNKSSSSFSPKKLHACQWPLLISPSYLLTWSILDISNKWNHIASSPFCLASFT